MIRTVENHKWRTDRNTGWQFLENKGFFTLHRAFCIIKEHGDSLEGRTAGMRFLKRLPIRTQLLLLAVSILCVVFGVILMSYSESLKAVSVNTREYTSRLISQNRKAIVSSCEKAARIIYNVAYNSSVQDFLLEMDPEKRIEIFKTERKFLYSVKGMNAEIIDIRIFDNESEQEFYHLLETNKEKFEQGSYNQENKRVYFSGMTQYRTGNTNYRCVMAAIHIYYSRSSDLEWMNLEQGTKIGSVVVVLSADQFSPGFQDTSVKTMPQLYLLDRNKKIFSSRGNEADPDLQSLFSGLPSETPASERIRLHGRDYLLQMESLPALHGAIIGLMDEKEAFAGIVLARQKALGIFLGSILLLGIPFLLVTNNILKPLNKLMRFMGGIKSGNLKNLKKRVELSGYSEIQVMAGEFNEMLDEIDSLTHRLLETNTRLYETEIMKKQSELAFLQSQINPHFLYNTLEAVKGMALVKDAGEIWEMAQALGQILRYSIKGADMVTLEEELNIVKAYIQIQQLRFGNRFEVFYDFPEEVLSCRVPKMILQPLVENAVYYGLEPKSCNGRLYVTGKRRGEKDLEIHIRDNGDGMEQPVLLALNEKLHRPVLSGAGKQENGTSGGIGIENVNNRLKIIFGEPYGINLSSEKARGTDVMVVIPLEGDSHAQSTVGG